MFVEECFLRWDVLETQKPIIRTTVKEFGSLPSLIRVDRIDGGFGVILVVVEVCRYVVLLHDDDVVSNPTKSLIQPPPTVIFNLVLLPFQTDG